MAGHPYGLTESDVVSLVLQNSGYRVVGAFNSYTTQDPTGNTTDVITPVTVGSGGTTADGSVSVDSQGTITILRPVPWFSKFRVRLTRTGAAGVSEIFFQAFRRSDNLSPWQPFGVSSDVELDNARQVEIFLDPSFLVDPVGTQYYIGWARSSLGNNSGILSAGTPSSALSTAGMQDAPSAQLTVFTLQATTN